MFFGPGPPLVGKPLFNLWSCGGAAIRLFGNSRWMVMEASADELEDVLLLLFTNGMTMLGISGTIGRREFKPVTRLTASSAILT